MTLSTKADSSVTVDSKAKSEPTQTQASALNHAKETSAPKRSRRAENQQSLAVPQHAESGAKPIPGETASTEIPPTVTTGVSAIAVKSSRTNSKQVELPPDAYLFREDLPAEESFPMLAKALSESGDLYHSTADDSELIRVDAAGKVHQIAPTTFNALVLDRIPQFNFMTSTGRLKARIPNAIAGDMLNCHKLFLSLFPQLDLVTTTPLYLADYSLTQPGYNDGGPGEQILYVGDPAEIATEFKAIPPFLAQMDLDRSSGTNWVGAGLTVLLRNRFPGQKPILLATASVPEAGKDTCLEAAAAGVPYESISYGSADWALEKNMARVLRSNRNVGMLVIENARKDKNDAYLASAALERVSTNATTNLFSTGRGESIQGARNNVVYAISMNDGTLSQDILSRSLPIHLAPSGDVSNRKSKIGCPRHEFLPKYRLRLAAELRGMVFNWTEAGQPLAQNVQHRFRRWASVIGGILEVNGFTGFLDNYQVSSRVSLNPVKEAIGVLGAQHPNVWMRPADWAAELHNLGLTNTVISSSADRGTEVARERGIGKAFTKYVDHVFIGTTEQAKLTLRLEKARIRANSGGRKEQPKVHYRFALTKQPEQLDDCRIVDVGGAENQ